MRIDRGIANKDANRLQGNCVGYNPDSISNMGGRVQIASSDGIVAALGFYITFVGAAQHCKHLLATNE